MVILRRAPAQRVGEVCLDESQRRVVDSTAAVLRVLGGPGTGKSTLAVELVVDAVSGPRGRVPRRGRHADCRRALRQRVTARLGGTSTLPLARTWQAVGFGILRAEAALRGDPTPRLLNGPEQDAILRDLLAGRVWGAPRRIGRPPRGTRSVLAASATSCATSSRAVEHGRAGGPAPPRPRARPTRVGRRRAGASRVRRGDLAQQARVL